MFRVVFNLLNGLGDVGVCVFVKDVLEYVSLVLFFEYIGGRVLDSLFLVVECFRNILG